MVTAPSISLAQRLRRVLWFGFMPGFFGFFTGCMTCHLLRTHAGTDAVTAAALAGLAGTFIPLPKRTDKDGVRAAIYTGAFAGMGSSDVIDTPMQVSVVSLVGAVFYIALTPFFQGLGGKLGAVAFAATAALLMMKALT